MSDSFPRVEGPAEGRVEIDRAARYLALDDTVCAVWGDTAPPDWFHRSVHRGRTARTLIEESERAEMLIVGSRRHGGFAGLLLDSVSQACAEHARCPVLVFHDDADRSSAAIAG